jgi:hypothetical protein
MLFANANNCGSWKYQSPPWSHSGELVRLYTLASEWQATRYIAFKPQCFMHLDVSVPFQQTSLSKPTKSQKWKAWRHRTLDKWLMQHSCCSYGIVHRLTFVRCTIVLILCMILRVSKVPCMIIWQYMLLILWDDEIEWVVSCQSDLKCDDFYACCWSTYPPNVTYQHLFFSIHAIVMPYGYIPSNISLYTVKISNRNTTIWTHNTDLSLTVPMAFVMSPWEGNGHVYFNIMI